MLHMSDRFVMDHTRATRSQHISTGFELASILDDDNCSNCSNNQSHTMCVVTG